MMAQPANKIIRSEYIDNHILPFHDEGEAGMLERMSTLCGFCDPELMSRSLPEMQILSASLGSFVLSAL